MAALHGTQHTLSTDIRPALLRAVRLERVLGNFGEHWSDSTGADPRGYSALSDAVTKLDDFLSHDWKSGRWLKSIALLVVYNATAAVVASTAMWAACVVLSLDSVNILPKLPGGARDMVVGGRTFPYSQSCWCMMICPSTFVFVLVFWQRIRSMLGWHSRMVFLDKLCIDQVNDGLKREGICSLAGFLKHTDRLVVLWSHRYFTRLWCNFEIISWLSLGRDFGRSVRFIPIKLTASLLTVQGALLLNTWCIYLILDSAANPSNTQLLMAVRFVGFLVPVHMLRTLMWELHLLPAQLEKFSIRDAECFCCSCGHVDPRTKATLSCDRELIYSTLESWGSSAASKPPGGGQLACLDAFDNRVRRMCKKVVVAQAGRIRLDYKQALIANLPFFWWFGDHVACLQQYPSQTSFLRAAVFFGAVYLFAGPCVMKILLLMAGATGNIGACRPALNVLLTLSVNTALLFTTAVLYWPLAAGMQAGGEAGWVVQAGAPLVEALLTVVLFRGLRVRRGCTWLLGLCSRRGRPVVDTELPPVVMGFASEGNEAHAAATLTVVPADGAQRAEEPDTGSAELDYFSL